MESLFPPAKIFNATVMRVKRFDDWEGRLDRYIGSVMQEEFQWGRMDCALFVCSCIETMTGVDPAKLYRGRYRTKCGAAFILKKISGGGLIEAVDKLTGLLRMPEIPAAMAQRGDVVLIETTRGACLGIVDLSGRFVLAANFNGLSRLPFELAGRAWRV